MERDDNFFRKENRFFFLMLKKLKNFFKTKKTGKKKSKGRTLVEVLMVVVIIGIFSSIAMTSISDMRKKSRDNKRISDLNQIYLAIKMYQQFDSKGYPIGVWGWFAQINNTCAGWYVGGEPIANKLTPFLKKIPEDPISPYPPVNCTFSDNYWYFYGMGFKYVPPEINNTQFGTIIPATNSNGMIDSREYVLCSKLERKPDIRIDMPGNWAYAQYCIDGLTGRTNLSTYNP